VWEVRVASFQLCFRARYDGQDMLPLPDWEKEHSHTYLSSARET
jgi:hypothetical protein